MISLKEAGNLSDQDIVGKFLPSCSLAIGVRYSDVQISGYIVLSVLGSQFRLHEAVKKAAIQSIILNWTKHSMKSGLSCITQLVKLDETFEPFDEEEWRLISTVKLIDSQIKSLYDQYDISQFVVKWSLSVIKYSPERLSSVQSVLSHGKLSVDDGLAIIIKTSILLSAHATTSVKVKEELLKFFEYLLSTEETAQSFKEILFSLGTTFDQLELNVQGSIETKFKFVKQDDRDEDEDVEMTQAEEATPGEILEQELKARVPTAVSSFLSVDSNDEFKHLVRLFTLAMQSKASKPLDTLQISGDCQPSFLIRVWTGAYPNLARVHALELFAKLIKNNSVDYQAVIPFVIIALADDSERVRRSASSIIRSLASKHDDGDLVWGLDNLYGSQSSEVKWLSSKHVESLLNVLSSNINECYLDSQYIFKKVAEISADKQHKSLQEPLLSFLASHAISMQLPQMKINLLRILQSWGKSNSSKYLSPILADWIATRKNWTSICEQEKVSFDALETAVVSIVSSGERAGISFLEESIKSSYSDLSVKAGHRIVYLWKSGALKSDTQLGLLRFLSEIAIDESVPYDSLDVLNNIDINTNLFVTVLDDCKLEREAISSGSPQSVPKRRRRSSNSSREKFRGGELISFAEKHLRKITILLELLEKNKPEGANVVTLLSQLFTILGEILSLGTDSNLPALYTEQLLANCMIEAVQQLKTQRHAKIDSSIVRVDIIVSCIRSSTSPQVQNRFLLLVANLAGLAPEVVLHSVMPIFTFMGANTIRQDDEFSAHVIQQTIAQVIPALVGNSGSNNNEIEFLLLSFVAAFAHIPRHRRVKLFGGLVRTLKPEESLHKLLVLFANKYSEAKVKRKSADLKSYVQFGETFVRSFSVTEQVIAIKNYLSVAELIRLDETGVTEGDDDTHSSNLIGPNDNIADNAVLKANLYEFLTSVFGSDEVIGGYQSLRVQILKSVNTDSGTKVMDVCSDIIEQLLKTRTSTEENVLLKTTTPSLGENVFKFLGKSLELLPVGQFVLVVKSLLQTSDNDVKQHALELVQSKFDIELSTDEDALKASIDVVDLLREYLSVDDTNTQLILDDIDIIVSKFGTQMNPEQLLATLKSIVDYGLLNVDSKVFVSAVSATNSLCTVLGARMIGLYGKIIPVVFKRFEASLLLPSTDEEAKFIQLSTFALISGLVKRIPSFMTSSIKKIFEFIFTSNATSIDVRIRLMDVIKTSVDNKQVISSLAHSWKFAVDNKMDVINLFLDSLDSVIDLSSKKVVSNQSATLVSFLLEAFEVRKQKLYSTEDTNRIEVKLVASSIQIVMKLNDKTFQPLFVRMVRWAMDDDSEYSRRIVFFKFFAKLLNSLKSIVTNYYGYLLDPVCELLTEYIPHSLKRNILNSLATSFQNDNDEFWQSQARFDQISSTLLAQIPVIDTTVGQTLVKAISSLCEVCSSNEHHKVINEGIASHMKSNCKSNEKILAVKILQKLYVRMGEEWVSMLPQLVPLIAELLEDEDEQVELEVRRHLVPAVEEVLGESLDRYLS